MLNFLRLNWSEPTLRQDGAAALRSMTQESVPLPPIAYSRILPFSYIAIPPPATWAGRA